MFHNIYIFGLGMMGGSLAHAIKEEKIVKKFMHMIRVDNPYYLLKKSFNR